MRPPFLISQRATTIIERQLSDNGYVQPHKHLLSWALDANINTEEVEITLMILNFTGKVDQRHLSVSKMKKVEKVYHLNSLIEDYMVERNKLIATWPESLIADPVLRENMLRVFDQCLDPLRERLRSVIRSQSNSTFIHEGTLKHRIDADMFLWLMKDVERARVAATATKYTIIFDNAEALDFIFQPTEEDLRVEATFHEYYGHRNLSRWYRQTFDDLLTCAPHEMLEDISICNCLRKKTVGVVSVVFFKKTSMLSVNLSWEISYKRASGIRGGMHGRWITVATTTPLIEGGAVLGV